MAISKNKIKYIYSLKEKKYRDIYKTFLAESDKLVAELLNILTCRMLVATPEFIQLYANDAWQVEDMVEVCKTDLSRVSQLKNPQQALAVFYQPEYSIDPGIARTELCIALDGIQDPGNMGTIIRLADWYGIENIFCSHQTVDVYNQKVVQSTMGALARVKVHYVDLYDFISGLGKVPVYGTFLEGENIYKKELNDSGIIIMGNEGKGIGTQLAQLVTEKLYIPSFPLERQTSESLNVAIATGIICSEFRRRSM